MLYLGIDSGGTKAAFLLMDERGNVIARHREPGCAVLGARKAGVKRMVETGLAAICEKADVHKEDIRALGLGISGYGEGEGTEQETQEACDEAFFLRAELTTIFSFLSCGLRNNHFFHFFVELLLF